MKHLLKLLKWDHLRFTALLNYLIGIVDGMESGDEPDYGELIELITYLKPGLKGRHQAEEQAIWTQLSRCIGPHQQPLAQVEKLQQSLVDRGVALEDQVRAAQAGAVFPRDRLRMLIEEFVSTFREQMALEEQTLFPLVESTMPIYERRPATSGGGHGRTDRQFNRRR